ncbi:unnamed protein product [Brachionus calyciflorus]|uniref:Aldehyde dehydrogenase domain-containing protein n=1 Tax=Brachionus calyciflorus TaxID=104777 RepID=A0A814E9U4_9BILA|nr:unnamed protein product [Brachionus calyciflorus]
MSALNPSVSNIKKVFDHLSYEPVLDSDSALKSWIELHNNGTFGPFINGQYQNKDLPTFQIKNPFNQNLLAKFSNCDKTVINEAIESCVQSAQTWSKTPQTERERIVYNMARNVQKHLNILVSCESISSGRTSREVKDLDVTQVIKTLYYYAGSSSLLAEGYTPVGTVGIFGYFDSSLLSLVNKLAPALVTGNSVLIVPHKLTPLSAVMLMDICTQSGLPNGVVNLITSDNDEIYNLICSDPRINCVCFDGKTSTAQNILTTVSPKTRTLFSLEGKTSMVIYDSADLDSAVETIVDGSLYSNGQHRYSLNKLFIQENIYQKVLKRLETRFSKLNSGNHMDKCNDIGQLINQNDIENFKQALSIQTNEFGAQNKQFTNSITPPTIIENVTLNSQVNLNEINGPYLMVIPFRTVKESVELVNNSRYGSGVCLYSQNISLVMEVSYLVNVGTVWVNSIPLERGVQTRKQSGDYCISGLRCLKMFIKNKWDDFEVEKRDRDEVLRGVKSFGSLSPTSALPLPTNLSEEKTYKNYIGGKQQRPDTQSSRLISLPNGEPYCLVPDSSRKDIRNAVESAHSAFNSWWKRSNFNKSQILYYFGENLRSRSKQFVDKLRLFGQSQEEAEKELNLCLNVINYYAGLCDKNIGKLNDTTEYGYLMEISEPLGVIAIVCGNYENGFSLFNFVQFLVGAISHGNSVIIIPDEKNPVACFDLYEVFDTSDMPGGVVNIVTGNKHHLTKYLTEHQQVASVWYLYDQNKDYQLGKNEQDALQFVKYTSSFSLKKTWFIPSISQLSSNGLNREFLNEISVNSTQCKYVHLPMGIIFAN